MCGPCSVRRFSVVPSVIQPDNFFSKILKFHTRYFPTKLLVNINLRGSERKIPASASVKVNTWNPPPSTHTRVLKTAIKAFEIYVTPDHLAILKTPILHLLLIKPTEERHYVLYKAE